MNFEISEIIKYAKQNFVVVEKLIHEEKEYYFITQIDENEKVLGNPRIVTQTVYDGEVCFSEDIEENTLEIIKNKFNILINIEYGQM